MSQSVQGYSGKLISVVAIETRASRLNEQQWAGFYGWGMLNQKRRAVGEKFEIRDTKTTPTERADRQQILKKLRNFGRPMSQADIDAFLTYSHFGSWMTLDLAYQPPVNKKAADAASSVGELGNPIQENVVDPVPTDPSVDAPVADPAPGSVAPAPPAARPTGVPPAPAAGTPAAQPNRSRRTT